MNVLSVEGGLWLISVRELDQGGCYSPNVDYITITRKLDANTCSSKLGLLYEVLTFLCQTVVD